MKNIAKKLFIIAAIIIMMCIISVVASAETYGNLTYKVYNGYITITDCSTSATKIDIPDKINGYPVTAIGSSAFYNCSRLSSITIPDSVTTIGSYAFYNCSGLTSITIPDSVTSIGDGAFSGCTGLTSITIPDSVKTIGSYAFSHCAGLTSITIPDSVTTIGSYAFSYCAGLTQINWNAKSVNAFAESSHVFFGAGAEGDGINVVFSDNVEKIPDYIFFISSAYSSEYHPKIKSVTIGSSVTTIGSHAFSNCTKLTSITISDSVTTIGDSAFYYCTGLTSVTIGNSVTTIGNSAFSDCSGLTSITIPDSITTIGSYAFKNCTGLTSVTIGNSVTTIGSHAFSNCTKLTSITISDSVTTIGSYAFYNCSGLTSITIPDSVTTIGSSAFYNCSGLTSITIPDSVTTIGSYAFHNTVYYNKASNWENNVLYIGKHLIDAKTDITKYTIRDRTLTISGSAFYNCTGLTSITIPDSVTSIGDDAFYNCTGLTSVTIPNSVTSIGNDAFYNCTAMTSVIIPDSVTTIGNSAFSDCSGLTSITIPDSITTIGSYAFKNCTGLTSVTIGNSVTTIGSYAFYNCAGLTSITIPDSVTSIGDGAFSDCTGLTSITIPDSVTSIGVSAFDNCTLLTSVAIGNSVTNINSYAFRGCTGLTKINWNAKNVSDFTSLSNVFNNAGKSGDGIEVIFGDNVEKIPAYCFYKAKIKSVQIGGSVTGIGVSAFENCTHLTSVTIGDSVTNINSYAFRGCTGLTKINWNAKNVSDFTSSSNVFYNAGKSGDGIEVIFGDNVEKIPAYLFYMSSSSDSPKVTSVIIGNSVTSIGNSAFYNCTGLTSVTLGDSVTSIGSSAFDNCTGLTSVTIPDSVTIIDNYSFYNCTSLTSVTLGDSVTTIGRAAFYNCTGLTSVTIPDSVTSIGSSVFRGCTGLTSVTIPNSVTSIGDDTFYNCTGLTKINWNAKNVSNFSSSAFYNVATSNSGLAIEFGKSVESIPDDLFDNLQSLTTINVDSENENFTSVDGVLFSKTLRRLIKYPAKKQGTFYTVPDSVYRFAPGAFRDCQYLEEVVINSNITIIDENMFCNCVALKTITIPEQITSIGDDAFSGCTGLTKINWNAKNVSDFASSSYVFYNAGKSTDGIEVIFGDNVEKIPAYCFYKAKIKSVQIGGSVTGIGVSAFENCTHLTSVTIGDSVTNINSYAFRGCTGLTNVTIPDSVTSIGNYAFSGCSGLTNVTIPDSVTSIGNYAFSGCSGLTNVTIGDSVTSIGYSAFKDCTGLTKINWDANKISSTTSRDYIFQNAGKNSENGGVDVIFGNKITTVPSYIFYNAYVKSVILPDNVKSIGNYAFYNCAPLTEIIIPDSVKSIGAYAFGNCTSLKNLSVPESVTTIGNAAFNNCSAMKHIYLYNPNCLTTDNVNNMIYQDTVIHSHTGYSVEAFANKYGYDFMELHTVSDEWTSSATCTEAGQKYHPCNYCDKKYDAIDVPATGHDYTTVVTEPTCETQGYTTHTCFCGYEYSDEYKEALGHTTTSGKCDNCKSYIVEKGATITISIKFVGSFSERKWKLSENNVKIVSTRTEYDVHELGYSEFTEYAEICGLNEGTDIINIYTNGKWYTVGNIIIVSHQTHIPETVKGYPATCFKDGLTDGERCSICGFVITEQKTIPEIGRHDYTSSITTPATCKQTGVRTYTCTVCKDTYTETIAKDSKNHVGGTEIRDAVAENCNNDGYTGDTYCLGCNAKIANGSAIPATGNHDYASEVTTPATCKTTGVRTYTCTVCEDTYTETINIDSANHTGGTKVRNAVAENCGNDGYTGDTYCLGCNVKIANGSVIPATGRHNHTSSVTSPATCKTTGVRTYTCTVCEDTYTETITIDTTNHSGGTEIRGAITEDCGNNGYTGDTYCLGCNVKIANGSVIPATGTHSYTSEVTTSATCITTGVRTYTCSVCKDSYTESVEIDSSNHIGGTELRNVIPPDCKNNGYTGDTYCLSCDIKLSSGTIIQSTGEHNYIAEVVTVANCHEKGLTVYSCPGCKSSYEADIDIDKSNHDGETEVRNEKDATCTSEGYSGDVYCTGCNEIVSAGKTINMLGHTEIVLTGKTATCTETGLTEGKKCSVCGEVLVAQKEISALGHKEEIISGKSATCTETGLTEGKNCSVCGEVLVAQKEIASTGHTVGEWEVVVPAQVGIEGKEQQKCTVCGAVVNEREIPALEPQYIFGDANGDGKITAADARIVLRISAKLDKIEDYKLPLAALDVTGDGKLNAADARKVLRISAKLE